MALNYSTINSANRKGYSSLLLSIAFMLHFSLLSGNLFAQKKKEKEKELDGKTFTIELTEEGKKAGKPISDEINFKSDKFKSKVMSEKNKFAAAPYTVTVDSSNVEERVVTFEAESKNDSDELLKWEGKVTDDNIEGTAVLSKKGKTKKEYSFSGSLKQKKK